MMLTITLIAVAGSMLIMFSYIFFVFGFGFGSIISDIYCCRHVACVVCFRAGGSVLLAVCGLGGQTGGRTGGRTGGQLLALGTRVLNSSHYHQCKWAELAGGRQAGRANKARRKLRVYKRLTFYSEF